MHLYSAFIEINPDKPFRFELDEIEIEKVHPDGMIETKCPYFTSSTYSSYYFGGNSGSKLDVPYKISDYILILYSTNKNVCRDFFNKKRLEIEDMISTTQKRLRESSVKENLSQDYIIDD